MIEEITFSDRGQRITAFEMRLLCQSTSGAAWAFVARRLIAELGPVIGAQAFAIALDELGGEKLHIPTRRHFFESLWRCERDALIAQLAARRSESGEIEFTYVDLGRMFGVSPECARKVALRQLRRTTGVSKR